MSLRSLVASLSGSFLTVDLENNRKEKLEGRFYVPSPTVRTALGLFAATEGLAAGIAGDAAVFARTSREWLPRELGEFMFADAFPFDRASAKVLELLSLGYEPRGATYDADLEKLTQRAQETSWHSILADYRHAYKSDPLAEPWLYFLAQFAEIPRLRARDEFSITRGYLATQSEESFKRLANDAFTATEEETKSAPVAMSPEKLAEQIEKANRLRGNAP